MTQHRFYLLLSLLFFAVQANSQFYFRGEVKDNKDNTLSLVRIHVHSTNSFYYSGSGGNFGIPSSRLTDTVSFLLNGYEEKTMVLNANEFNHVQLKITFAGTTIKKKLHSITQNNLVEKSSFINTGGETYSELVENVFTSAAEFPLTSISLDVDKASYSNIRRFINLHSAVPKDAVRIEEMLNYFPQQLPAPLPGKMFHFQTQLTDCPWNPLHKLLFLQLQAKKINYDSLPPGNFVFLIDISGSMELPNRLPLLQTAFRMLVENMRAKDTISVMVYGGSVGVVLQPTSGIEKKKIMAVIDSLAAGGDTPGESAIRQAYTLAQRTFIKGGNNRIILATDGDFNVGEVSDEALMQLIAQKQQTGIYLTCLGVGMGNYKDSKLEVMAKKGNGNFAYLDNVQEAEKVLVKELMQTMYAVADQAFLNVKFNPQFVKQYRLIGYDNRKDAMADSSTVAEGGEIGTGHSIVSVFEVELKNDSVPANAILADAGLTYLPFAEKEKQTEIYSVKNNYRSLSQCDSSYRFASAVTWFGLLLRQSPYVNSNSWNELIQLLAVSVNANDKWQKEMSTLVLKAKEIYKPERKKIFFNKKKG